jgi:hypothetical protein
MLNNLGDNFYAHLGSKSEMQALHEVRDLKLELHIKSGVLKVHRDIFREKNNLGKNLSLQEL